MPDRKVTATRKDAQGVIRALCNPEAPWSPLAKNQAIADIDGGKHRYFVAWPDGVKTWIRTVPGPSGKYLRTDKDTSTVNNLLDLPDC